MGITAVNRFLRCAFLGAPFFISVWAGSVLGAPQTLFSYRGKEVSVSDLTVADQLSFFEIEEDRFARYSAKIDDLILKHHFETLAKSQKVGVDDVEKRELAITDPTDSDATKWFDMNKARLPSHLTFEQVKEEIKSHLKQERAVGKKAELLTKIKAKGDVKVLLTPPEAPKISIQTESHPVRGAKSAKVTMVEFADYQCPHCKAAGEAIEKALKKYEGQINLVFMDFPINPSGISKVVAEGAVCADEQGHYWDYHDRAYDKQSELTKESPLKLARDLKLDEAKFQACLASSRPKERLAKDKAEVDRLGLSGTPAIFIGGVRVRSYEEKDLTRAIESALSGRRGI
jgi:protein-disulfide isomerase